MSQSDSRDDIFAQPMDVVDFHFDDSVVQVFPDMIRRSVPGYSTIIHMIEMLAERYVQPGSRVYDLGCSLGASSFAMLKGMNKRQAELVAVDNSESMVTQLKQLLSEQGQAERVKLVCGDLQQQTIEDASMVVLNFTLQFIAQAERDAVIERIYQGMRPGGVLVLSEKLAFDDAHLNELFIDMHHSFKRAQGYSDLEISQKRSALDNVLIPETLAQHRARLQRAGFDRFDVWFQCFNFASMLAIK